jgi:hypothetical protein
MLHRRQMLRAAGIALALPMLEASTPGGRRCLRAGTSAAPPKRMLAICNNLGLLPEKFFPSEAGRDYTLSPYLQELADHREAFTVFSGVSHPSVDGSHSSDVSFLTAAPHPASGGFRNTISLDQLVAAKVGNQTRYPSLTLGVNVKESRRSLSWTGGGVLIPCENSAAAVFSKLFLQGSEREIENQVRRLQLGQSIMDTLAEQARALDRRLGSQDRARMDQFVTAVRDVEQRMVEGQQWERTAKPAAPSQPPNDPADPVQYMDKTRLMYQMARLAFDTDSTRAITLLLDSNNSPTIQVDGAQIEDGYHNLSHHGRNDKKLAQLEAIDRAHLRLLAELLTDLKNSQTSAGSLLDDTLILFGSNFGDANKHTTDNMPILLAGGGFRHGQHLMFDQQKNYPLPNLFVSMLQDMGLESDRFASSTGTMRGL